MWKPKPSENRSWRLILVESARRFLTGTPAIWRRNATGRPWLDTFSRFLKTRNCESDSAPLAANVLSANSIWKSAQRFWKKFTRVSGNKLNRRGDAHVPKTPLPAHADSHSVSAVQSGLRD